VTGDAYENAKSQIGGRADCPDFGPCANDELLQHMRTGADRAGLFVRGPGLDRTDAIDSWTPRLKRSWPSSILFTEEA
jgi:hypothetical protein